MPQATVSKLSRSKTESGPWAHKCNISLWTTNLLWSATSLKLKRPDWALSDPFRLRTPLTCPIFVQVPTAYRTSSKVLDGLLDG